MGMFDTLKTIGGSAIKEAAPIGIQLLKDEVGIGAKAVPETRPDTKSQPIATTQKFEPTQGIKVSKPVMIGGGLVALVGLYLVMRRK